MSDEAIKRTAQRLVAETVAATTLRKRVVTVSKRGPGFAAFAQVALADRLKLLKQTLEVALDLAEAGILTDADIARLRDVGRKA